MNERQAFIEQFSRQRVKLIEPTRDERRERRRYRGAIVFWSSMGILGLCPFILGGLFFYALNRYNEIMGMGDLAYLVNNLDPGEIEHMGQATGLPDLPLAASLYRQRHVILALDFTFFLTLIALCIAVRGVWLWRRK